MEPSSGGPDGSSTMKAVGVKLSDGRQFRSKTVISNASRWDTFEGMIGEEAHGRYTYHMGRFVRMSLEWTEAYP